MHRASCSGSEWREGAVPAQCFIQTKEAVCRHMMLTRATRKRRRRGMISQVVSGTMLLCSVMSWHHVFAWLSAHDPCASGRRARRGRLPSAAFCDATNSRSFIDLEIPNHRHRYCPSWSRSFQTNCLLLWNVVSPSLKEWGSPFCRFTPPTMSGLRANGAANGLAMTQ